MVIICILMSYALILFFLVSNATSAGFLQILLYCRADNVPHRRSARHLAQFPALSQFQHQFHSVQIHPLMEDG